MSSSGAVGDGGGFDLPAFELAAQALDTTEPARGGAHVTQLQAVLRMHALLSRAGLSLSAPTEIALRLRCSEHRANQLLTDASILTDLPEAFDLLATGILTVEQSRTLCQQLTLVDQTLQLQIWERVARRLIADRDHGIIRPPARLGELLRKLILELDPGSATERRKQAEADGAVDYNRRDDGLANIHLLGMTGPNAQAVLQRIQQHSTPVGHSDERTADKRRLEAAVDLLLGRTTLPLDHPDDLAGGAGGAGSPELHCRPGCGCTIGAPVPCGTDIHVHIPLGGALGTTNESAEVAGHGPIEADLTDQLLHSAPRLWPVWTDEHGIPVATGDKPLTPPRGDREAVRQALLDLANMPPPPPQPRHPMDHPPPPGRDERTPASTPAPLEDSPDAAAATAEPPTTSRSGDAAGHHHPVDDHLVDGEQLLAEAALAAGATHTDGAGLAGADSPVNGSPAPGHPHPPATACRPDCAGCCRSADPAASSPAAEPAPPAATSTTTSPGPTGRPARATSARSAEDTTGSSNKAGPKPATPPESTGTPQPDRPGPAPPRTHRRSRNSGRSRLCRANPMTSTCSAT